MSTLPQLIAFQVPQFNLADTYTAMARLAAYDASRRSSLLEQEEKRGKLDREALWRQTIAGAIEPTPTVPGQGFAAPQPPAPTQPPAQGFSAAAPFTSTMAQQVPPATPEQGGYAMMAPRPSLPPAGTSYGTAPIDLQSRVGLEGRAGPPPQGGGFTQAPAAAPAPQQGFTGPQPTRPLSASVPHLMPMPNAQAVQQAFAIDPEKTSQWYGAYLTQRGKQLDEVKRNNQLVYQTTSAILENPQYYAEGLDYLRENGVPVPKNMPPTYDPALVKFHRDVSRERLNPLEEAQMENQKALAQLNQAKVGTEEQTQRMLQRFRERRGLGDGGTEPARGGAEAGDGGTATLVDTRTLSPAFLTKSQEVAGRLGMRPDDLLRIIHFETGGTFDAGARNRAGSGATGLIQFMPDTAKALGTTTDALAKMSPEQQLDYVEKYLSQYKGKIGNLQDAYMAVLYPDAIGKSGSHKLFTKEGTPTAYRQNAGLDTDQKGYVTVQDAVNAVQRTTGGRGTAGTGGTATASATNPQVSRLNQEIAQLERDVEEMSVTPGMNVYADNLKGQLERKIAERNRLEPSPAKLAEAREGELTRAQYERATKEEIDAINRTRPEGQKIPYGTTKADLRRQGLGGGEQVPQGVLDDLSARSSVVQQFEELSTNVGALPTGPLAGRLEAIKQRFGIDVTDEKVAYRQILATAFNQLAAARSGMAINAAEFERLKAELPGPEDPPQVFKARLATAARLARNIYKTKAQTYRKAGYALSDELMEPLANPEPPPAPTVTSNVDKFKAIKP